MGEAEAGVGAEQTFLGVEQAKLLAEHRIGEGGGVNAAKRPHQHGHCRLQKLILPRCQKAWPQRRAERPAAERQVPARLQGVEMPCDAAARSAVSKSW